MGYYIILIICLSYLDLYTKDWAKKHLIPGFGRYILNGKVELLYVENRGIAFDKLHNRKKLIISMGVCLLVFLAYLFLKDEYYRPYISFIFAGGLGNTMDRIHRGYVVDFIRPNIKNSPVFNLADFYIFFGIILSILQG